MTLGEGPATLVPRLRGAREVRIKKMREAPPRRRPAGAWKIAYADFATAMMAFFLVMWLINSASPAQKRGIADYFTAQASESANGSGSVLAGRAAGPSGARDAGADLRGPIGGSADDADFAEAEAAVRAALRASPDLQALGNQVVLAEDPRGLTILLVDAAGRPMFAAGSAAPSERARQLLLALAPVIAQLPHRIAITGHTSAERPSAAPASDWALSSARAEAARRILIAAGVDPDRVFEVAGKAASDPLWPDHPDAPGNRRVAIMLMREAPVLPPLA
jgi:chemotaxis protein MotB